MNNKLNIFDQENLNNDYDKLNNYKYVLPYPSILDKDLYDLVSMDIEELRSVFLNEIKSLKNVSEEKRNIQLERIFHLLFSIQPKKVMQNKENFDFLHHEQRLYADLISTPGLSEIDYVIDFLKNKFQGTSVEQEQLKSLLTIFEYYSNHSKDVIDKFNYIYRSSDKLAIDLYKYKMDFDFYFSERIMSCFSKEDLSQIFRFYFYGNAFSQDLIIKLFSPENSRALFMISQMAKKVKSITGHNSEFLHGCFSLIYADSFVFLLNDVYKQLVVSPENEEAFDLTYSKCDNLNIMNQLINYISLVSCDKSVYIKGISLANNSDMFINKINAYREENHNAIFGEGALEKIKNGTFDIENDFKKIVDLKSLQSFQNAILYNLFGISLEEAIYLKNDYGKNIDVLEKSIIEEDRSILEMLKSIITVVDLGMPNLKEKLDVLRVSYLEQIQEKGEDYQHVISSATLIEGLLSRMYMNSFNKILTSVSEKHKLIKYDYGVPLLDAGVEFNFLLNSFNGVGNFYNEDLNMASKWNTAAMSRIQGLCTSFINNENLGAITFSINSFLGFTNIPQYCLNIMGACDIFTGTAYYNLKKFNDTKEDNHRYFIPASILADETRYGYNEILLDRFLMDDENGNLKLQPSYVIYYKMDDSGFDIFNNDYKTSLKLANEFNIPIMVIDVPKVKQHEKEVIKEKEKELFSNTKLKPELLKEIVTRYMNNYTGSLTMVGEEKCNFEEDFSVLGMKNFFTKLKEFIVEISDNELKFQWLSNLADVYFDEKRKFDIAASASVWNQSVKTFILNNYINEKEILKFKTTIKKEKNIIDKEIEEQTEVDYFPKVNLDDEYYAIFLTDKSFTPVAQTIVNFSKYLNLGVLFDVIDYDYNDNKGKLAQGKLIGDNNEQLIENLICCYFLGNCNYEPATDLFSSNFNFDMDFNLSKMYDFYEDFNSSKYVEKIKSSYNPVLVDTVISKIEELDKKKFLNIFLPVIKCYSKDNCVIKEEIGEVLLDRKNNIRSNFDKLNKLGCGIVSDQSDNNKKI